MTSETTAKLSLEAVLKQLLPDPVLLLQLERMNVAAGRRVKGTLAGKRRSSTLGGSQEFADYRPYSPGDDIRRLDWNVYSRTRRAYVRQYWDEQELHVHLYVDISPSMNYGLAHTNKLSYALRLAASIGYAALSGEDRLSVKLFNHTIAGELPILRGRGAIPQMLTFLGEHSHAAPNAYSHSAAEQRSAELADSAALDMSLPFRTARGRPQRAGVTWLITDALYEEGLADTLVMLASTGQEVVLIHLLSPQEINPELTGELRLIDSELLSGKEVAVSQPLLAKYRNEVKVFGQEQERICHEHGVVYQFVDTDTPVEYTVQRTLVEAGLLHIH
ncbi:DUF58 domain-containing protein [Paenibacillus sp. GCM10023252]|uniref:DUF58 domain-containing protein n=1 Tax=Paenibacillus sp. GCM10023252 TaxID=3252649 RepID=UPI0036075455